MSLKPRGYTLSDTFFIFLFLLSGSTELKILFNSTKQKAVLWEQVLIAGCEKLLQKVESSSTFCNKIRTSCAFYRTKETCFAASDVTPVYDVIPALFYPIRRRYSRNLSQLDLLRGRFWTWVAKHENRYSARVAAMFLNKLHVFVARFTGAFNEDWMS